MSNLKKRYNKIYHKKVFHEEELVGFEIVFLHC